MHPFDGLLFDCDNHYYEAEDASLRHVPRKMQKRCVQRVEMDRKRRPLVAGERNPPWRSPRSTPSPSPAFCGRTIAAIPTARPSSS
jgi:hypothetical protein